MAATMSLPTASPKTVKRVFLEVLDATDETVFTQRSLAEMGIAQKRQGLSLLHSLDLLTGSGRLKSDVLAVRENSDQLRVLLVDRLQVAFQQAGCEAGQAELFGRPSMHQRELTEQLKALEPIQRLHAGSRKLPKEKGRSKAAMASNMISCLRAVYDVLQHAGDRQWLESELVVHQRRDRVGLKDSPGSSTSRPAITNSSTSSGPSLRERVTPGSTIRQTIWRAATAVDASDQHQLEPIPIAFTAEGDAVYARISVDVPIRSEHLLRLGKRLLEMAAAVEPTVR